MKTNDNTLTNYKRTKETIADGIAITDPVRIKDIIHVVKETKGDIIIVKERDILSVLYATLRKGYYIEPTSAVAIADFKKYHIRW